MASEARKLSRWGDRLRSGDRAHPAPHAFAGAGSAGGPASLSPQRARRVLVSGRVGCLSTTRPSGAAWSAASGEWKAAKSEGRRLSCAAPERLRAFWFGRRQARPPSRGGTSAGPLLSRAMRSSMPKLGCRCCRSGQTPGGAILKARNPVATQTARQRTFKGCHTSMSR
jgi:hypothetical protein